MSVSTVRGPVRPEELGFTLMHEHIFVLSPDMLVNYGDYWDETARRLDAVERLRNLKAAGIDTIVDLTVVGLGRDIGRIAAICEQVDLNVVVATGLYTFDELPLYLRMRGPGTTSGGMEPMIELFVRDIVDGIGDTGVHAGMLKCATDEPGVTPGVERVLRAVAVAHRETGVPISTHTSAMHRRGLDQLTVFRQEGVDVTRVVIGHSGDTTDLDYLQALMSEGVTVGLDRFGNDPRLGFEPRIDTVVRLCERGYAHQMVLSHDTACFNEAFHTLPREHQERVAPRWHYLHIVEDVVPALRARGVTDEQLNQMLVVNPRRMLTRIAPY